MLCLMPGRPICIFVLVSPGAFLEEEDLLMSLYHQLEPRAVEWRYTVEKHEARHGIATVVIRSIDLIQDEKRDQHESEKISR